MPETEADTCRRYVLPKLYASGWSDDHISEQKTFTDGRIVVSGDKCFRKKPKRADYLLRYKRDFMIAVVEAKASYKKPSDGLQQAKEYAEILGVKFAYSTNGHGIVEHDYLTGKERETETFPSPDDLWQRIRQAENNFPEDKKTSETTLLFLQLIMRKLRRPVGGNKPGRCGIVLPNGTLFGDGVCARVKEELLREFNLHTIVRLPNGVFSPYTGIPTNLLFFDRSGPTKEIWYYEQPLPDGRKNYTKTKPIQFEEFGDCINWWNKRKENNQAWKAKVKDVIANNYNLDIKNPKAKEDFEHMPPERLVEDIVKKEQRILEIMAEITQVLEK